MRRWVCVAGFLAVAAIAAGVWLSGSVLISAAPQAGAVPPAGLVVHEVAFPNRDGATRGWMIPGVPGRGVVLLLHGVRANRMEMADRAVFLSRAGFGVLLIDFQAHGQSDGKAITFGFLEKHDVASALQYLRREYPREKIAVIGMSLGGAAAVLAAADGPEGLADAYVLEAVYGSLRQALDNRLALALGPLGPWFDPLLIGQLKLRLGFGIDDLRPAQAIKSVRAPVFVIAGDADRHATFAETQEIFRNAPGPKQLWVVNAGHQDFHRYVPDAYVQRVSSFLTETISSH